MKTWLSSPLAYWLLGGLVLIVRIATALPIERAGYMDASYTVHVASNLASGRGFTEDVLWNYLDAPTGLPHPSNLYWLPLPALLAAASFVVFGGSYHAAQLPFLLLSVFPPLFAFYLSRRIFRRYDYAWMAGLVTAFGGFYLVYWVSPDNFTPFAVTADLALLWAAIALGGEMKVWPIAGMGIGLSQLSRADGFLLLAVVPIALVLLRRPLREIIWGTLLASTGFLLVLTPWLVRNYAVAGSPLGAGGARALFLTNYEEFFRYQVQDLTLARYLDWGLVNIITSKINAVVFDLGVLILGAMQIFLAPFAIIGLWQLRKNVVFKPVLIYLVLLLAAMSLAFTFPGRHGSMLHSSIALVAFCAVAVPPGLDAAIRWIARHRRRWNERTAQRFFRVGFTALAFCLGVFTYSQSVLGDVFSSAPASPIWNARDMEYPAVGRELDAIGISRLDPVMTVDPPSFFNETGRRSIYIPTDDIQAIFRAARQFGAHFMVLENDRPHSLDELYARREKVDGLVPVAAFKDALGRPVTLLRIETIQ